MKSAAFAKNQNEREVKATIARRVDVETPDKTPDISSWRPWEHAMFWDGLEEGRFYTTEDLGVLRQELLSQNLVPKVSIVGKQMEIKKLTINGEKKTIIQRVPDEWEQLQAFMTGLARPVALPAPPPSGIPNFGYSQRKVATPLRPHCRIVV